MTPENDENTPPAFNVNPAGVITADGPQPPASAASQHPGAGPRSAEGEPGVADGAGADWPSAASAPSAQPVPPVASPAGDGGTDPRSRWHEIQAMFVDDPRSSVELAAGLVDASADALVASIRERQHALLSAWHGDNAGTEELRIALKQYRTYWDYLGESSSKS